MPWLSNNGSRRQLRNMIAPGRLPAPGLAQPISQLRLGCRMSRDRHPCDVGFELLRTTDVWMLSSPSCSPVIHSTGNGSYRLTTNDDHCCPACTTHSRCHGRYHCSSTPCNVESCPVRLLGSLASASVVPPGPGQAGPFAAAFIRLALPRLSHLVSPGLVSSCLACLRPLTTTCHYLSIGSVSARARA